MHPLYSRPVWGLYHLPEAWCSPWPAMKHKNLEGDAIWKEGLKDNSHTQLSNVFVLLMKKIQKPYRKLNNLFLKKLLGITK